jgi:hypothetical protein
MLRIQHCLGNWLTDGGKDVSLKHRPRISPQEHFFSLSFWYSFLLEAEWTPGPSAAGRIRYIEKIHLIGSQSRDFPACSIVT